MNVLTKVWSGIEKNRWTTIVPFVGVVLWLIISMSCVPTTKSPIGSGVKVNASELKRDYQTWLADNELKSKMFEFAAEDIKTQQEKWNKFTSVLMQVASGNVTSFQGLLNIFLGSGLLGVGADNVRKNGVIAGLKRGKKPKKK